MRQNLSQKKRGNPKLRTGIVTSEQMDKTVVVAIVRTFQHPRFKKVVRRTTKVLAHDEQNTCQVGDLVEVVEMRPLSRRKRWRVRQIVSKAEPTNA
jgi:small subunit ribosomal protein S17